MLRSASLRNKKPRMARSAIRSSDRWWNYKKYEVCGPWGPQGQDYCRRIRCYLAVRRWSGVDE